MVTGGIFALFLMANVFSGFSDQLDWLNALSIFSLFDANAQIQGDSTLRSFLLLVGILVVSMLLSYGRFTRKDLTI
jgi:ABC-2 type transport system permease protein